MQITATPHLTQIVIALSNRVNELRLSKMKEGRSTEFIESINQKIGINEEMLEAANMALKFNEQNKAA
jgi:hypothetical protein